MQFIFVFLDCKIKTPQNPYFCSNCKIKMLQNTIFAQKTVKLKWPQNFHAIKYILFASLGIPGLHIW